MAMPHRASNGHLIDLTRHQYITSIPALFRASRSIARRDSSSVLLLLHIKGYPGRDYAYVGELAERLQAHAHGVVALVTRCASRGLVQRRPSERDGREVEVHLLPKGERLLLRLASLHRTELVAIRNVFPVPVFED
jgi:DNA-binding MarR family transcriptional regulator